MACANSCQAILIATITSPVAGNLASFQLQAEGRPSELQRLHKIALLLTCCCRRNCAEVANDLQ